jgi:cyclophilin family peptidyl-prolyl cis-trans isomerase
MISARSSFVFALLVLSAPVALRAQATTPAGTAPLPAAALAPGGAPMNVDLRNHFGLPGVTGTVVQFNTVLGRFNFELFADTPLSSANFLGYVNSGAYNNTIIHRSVAGFVIQGGGYTYSVTATHIPTSPAVRNEFRRSNLRGTVAMAKLGGNPDSATSEWFVNLGDNSANLDNQNGGFTVFARVLGNGMSVVESIAALPVGNVNFGATGTLENVPLRNVTAGQTQLLLQNLIGVTSASVIPVYPTGGGAAVLTFSAVSGDPAVVEAVVTDSVLTLTPGAAGSASVTVTATDTNGASASRTVTVTVATAAGPSAPVIVAQPPAQIPLAAGTRPTLALTVAATGNPAPTYQWRRNGVDLDGQRSATCVLANIDASAAGTYTCVVRNASGSSESRAATVTFAGVAPADAGRLVNLSILSALAADETMTMGTVLGGAGTGGNKALLARVAGPSLTPLGVADVLPDPRMALLAAGATAALASNDDWGGTPALDAAFRAVGAFPYASAGSKDAALHQPELPAGGYTVRLGETQGRPGVGIAELYDATPRTAVTTATPRLVNVSVLKLIAAEAPLTAGFVIGGTTARTVLVRGIGPGLAAFGVTETMSDPQLTLFGADAAKLAENDNWGGAAALATVSEAVGAFAIASGTSNDAMLLLTLPPGSYTVRLDGKGAAGTALVEVYEVP